VRGAAAAVAAFHVSLLSTFTLTVLLMKSEDQRVSTNGAHGASLSRQGAHL